MGVTIAADGSRRWGVAGGGRNSTPSEALPRSSSALRCRQGWRILVAEARAVGRPPEIRRSTRTERRVRDHCRLHRHRKGALSQSPKRIVLINGEHLAHLMVRHDGRRARARPAPTPDSDQGHRRGILRPRVSHRGQHRSASTSRPAATTTQTGRRGFRHLGQGGFRRVAHRVFLDDSPKPSNGVGPQQLDLRLDRKSPP